MDGDNVVASKTVSADAANTVTLAVAKPKLWSPKDPFLYDVEISLADNGKTLDEIDSYAGSPQNLL